MHFWFDGSDKILFGKEDSSNEQEAKREAFVEKITIYSQEIIFYTSKLSSCNDFL